MTFDPATLLPPPAAAIFTRLRDKALDLHAAAMAARQRLEDARELRNKARVVLQTYTHQTVGRTQANIDKLEADLAGLGDEFSKADAAYAERIERWQAVATVVRALETYIGDLPKTVKITAAPLLPKAKGVPADTVAACRKRVAQIKSEIATVEAAPLPTSEITAKALAEVDALAAAGEPDLANLIADAGPIDWPMTDLHLRLSGAAAAVNGETVDTLALFAWLHRDALRKRIIALVEEQSDDTDAVPRDKRPKMIAGLRADLLEVERQECAAIADDGYRAECDPRAILGLADGLPPPREP